MQTLLQEDLDLRSLVNNIRIYTPDFRAGMAALTQWMLATLSGVQVCSLIIGESGTGKTELLKMFVAQHRAQRDQNGIIRPIVLVLTPTSLTAIGLLEAILEALGDPRPGKGTRPEKMRRVVKALKDQKVLMLLLDDVQHCLDKNSGLVIYDASECLKELINKTSVSLIGAGLEEAKDVVDSNEQSTKRHRAPVRIRRFDWADRESQNAFVALLAAFQKHLHMFDLPKLTSPSVALRMYLASGGLVDFVAKILSQAIWDALDCKRRVVALTDLGTAWLKSLHKAERLGNNPFDKAFNLKEEHLNEQIRFAKLINQHVVRPVSKRRAKFLQLAAVQM